MKYVMKARQKWKRQGLPECIRIWFFQPPIPIIFLFYHTSLQQLLGPVPILLVYVSGVANRFMSIE
jgi:hypothetical protein